jgi:hypothetical protein
VEPNGTTCHGPAGLRAHLSQKVYRKSSARSAHTKELCHPERSAGGAWWDFGGVQAARRGSIRFKWQFFPCCSHGMGSGLLRLDLEHPGAVGKLVFEVQLAVVGGAHLPHFPDDFQPALAQAAQRLGVAFASLAQGVVGGRRPRALRAALVRAKRCMAWRRLWLQARRRWTLWSCPDW